MTNYNMHEYYYRVMSLAELTKLMYGQPQFPIINNSIDGELNYCFSIGYDKKEIEEFLNYAMKHKEEIKNEFEKNGNLFPYPIYDFIDYDSFMGGIVCDMFGNQDWSPLGIPENPYLCVKFEKITDDGYVCYEPYSFPGVESLGEQLAWNLDFSEEKIKEYKYQTDYEKVTHTRRIYLPEYHIHDYDIGKFKPLSAEIWISVFDDEPFIRIDLTKETSLEDINNLILETLKQNNKNFLDNSNKVNIINVNKYVFGDMYKNALIKKIQDNREEILNWYENNKDLLTLYKKDYISCLTEKHNRPKDPYIYPDYTSPKFFNESMDKIQKIDSSFDGFIDYIVNHDNAFMQHFDTYLLLYHPNEFFERIQKGPYINEEITVE